MKKIISLLLLLVCFNAQTQTIGTNLYVGLRSTQNTTSINLNLNVGNSQSYGYEPEPRVGPLLLLGGATFIVSGLLTPVTYVGGSTVNQKPFIQQPRTFVMLTGALLSTFGLIITISGN